MEEIRTHQCELGELRWLATAVHPDICACLPQLSSKVNSLQGRDIYRIDDLIKTAKECEYATVLKDQSGPLQGSLTLVGYRTLRAGAEPRRSGAG